MYIYEKCKYIFESQRKRKFKAVYLNLMTSSMQHLYLNIDEVGKKLNL